MLGTTLGRIGAVAAAYSVGLLFGWLALSKRGRGTDRQRSQANAGAARNERAARGGGAARNDPAASPYASRWGPGARPAPTRVATAGAGVGTAASSSSPSSSSAPAPSLSAPRQSDASRSRLSGPRGRADTDAWGTPNGHTAGAAERRTGLGIMGRDAGWSHERRAFAASRSASHPKDSHSTASHPSAAPAAYGPENGRADAASGPRVGRVLSRSTGEAMRGLGRRRRDRVPAGRASRMPSAPPFAAAGTAGVGATARPGGSRPLHERAGPSGSDVAARTDDSRTDRGAAPSGGGSSTPAPGAARARRA